MFKKFNRSSVASQVDWDALTPAEQEEILAATKACNRERVKIVLKNVVFLIIAAGAGILVYRLVEDKFGNKEGATAEDPVEEDTSEFMNSIMDEASAIDVFAL